MIMRTTEFNRMSLTPLHLIRSPRRQALDVANALDLNRRLPLFIIMTPPSDFLMEMLVTTPSWLHEGWIQPSYCMLLVSLLFSFFFNNYTLLKRKYLASNKILSRAKRGVHSRIKPATWGGTDQKQNNNIVLGHSRLWYHRLSFFYPKQIG